MTAAAAGVSTQTDEAVARTLLAALDPGPFAPVAADSRPMTALEHTLFVAETKLQDALVLFEKTGEHRLADALDTLIVRVVDRMGEVAEEAGAA